MSTNGSIKSNVTAYSILQKYWKTNLLYSQIVRYTTHFRENYNVLYLTVISAVNFSPLFINLAVILRNFPQFEHRFFYLCLTVAINSLFVHTF